MVQVKSMRADDFPFATKLANTMDWKMSMADFEFMSSLEPEGCFVLSRGSERLGIATSISFGNVGWFGNLIVKETARRKGAGTLLVQHAINYLQSKGVRTIGLYAYPNLVGFYSGLGFKYDEDFSVLRAEVLKSSPHRTLPKVGIQTIEAIEQLDSQCFGGERKKLLESIILQKGNLCSYELKGNEIVGYLAGTVYREMAWVGPLICRASQIEAAASLVKSVLANLDSSNVYAALPKKEAALLKLFFDEGFKEDFCVSRMFLGPSVAKNCIYLAESLERG